MDFGGLNFLYKVGFCQHQYFSEEYSYLCLLIALVVKISVSEVTIDFSNSLSHLLLVLHHFNISNPFLSGVIYHAYFNLKTVSIQLISAPTVHTGLVIINKEGQDAINKATLSAEYRNDKIFSWCSSSLELICVVFAGLA